ncbi:MAG TPA: MerR family transcriptional regulator [Trebonia sp.]
MKEPAELYTIGEVARRVGVPARTIRFWCDAGVLTPTGRSAAGYRRFDAAAVARLDLVRTLRDLGLGLDDIRALLGGRASLAEIASVHAAALDAQIRVLRLRRAVLRGLAARGGDLEEARQLTDLARLSARERQQIIDDFVGRAFAGTDPGEQGVGIAQRMRALPVELPDEPTPEQTDAWIELAGLVADESFRQRVREMALAGAGAGPGASGPQDAGVDFRAVTEHAGRALSDGVDPVSARAGKILDQIVPRPGRDRLAAQLETFTDERVERYWQLVGVLNGRPPLTPMVPVFRWLIAALRAH